MAATLDYINLMSYDYHGWWDGHPFTGADPRQRYKVAVGAVPRQKYKVAVVRNS